MENNQIAEALQRASEQAQINACQIIQSAQLTRPDRELLQRTGWLEELIRGWYLLTRPDVQPGDTTPWYANFWDFLRLYLTHRYGDSYILSAESSLLLHTGSTIIPQQIIVIVAKGGTGLVKLPYNTSVYCYIDRDGLPDEVEEYSGLRVMSFALCMTRTSPSFFQNSSEEARIALSMVPSPEILAAPLLKYELHAAASRLIGGLKSVGRDLDSAKLEEILKKGGLKIKAVNPFATQPAPVHSQFSSPYYNRIVSCWENYRNQIVDLFKNEKFSRLSQEHYLASAVKHHEEDAYHSLSIEGYQVTAELIAQVESGSWNPLDIKNHQEQRNALAARGYYEAFLEVQKSIDRIFSGDNAGTVFRQDLSRCYQALWHPCVQAGILSYADTLGYRSGPVYIRGSRHVPPPKEALIDAMEALFTCLERDPSPWVRAILGHYFFVYIHPYPDGNGRIARFLMNVQLASDRIPWCVIRQESRTRYFAALEQARIEQDITSFARLVKEALSSST